MKKFNKERFWNYLVLGIHEIGDFRNEGLSER